MFPNILNFFFCFCNQLSFIFKQIVLIIFLIQFIILNIFAQKSIENFDTSIKENNYQNLKIKEILINQTSFSKKRILSLIDIQKDTLMDIRKINKAYKKLINTGAFNNIKIKIQNDKQLPDYVTLYFVFDEYPKIGEIKFSGNQKYQSVELEEAVGISPKDYFSEILLSQARDKIKQKYREDGYLLTEVSITSKLDKKNNLMIVLFAIDEGSEILIKSIKFISNKIISDRQLLNTMETKVNRWYRDGQFDDLVLEEDKEKIITRYKNKGHIKANIKETQLEYEWKNPRKKKARSMKIAFLIEEGKQYKFGNLIIKGNDIFDLKNVTNNLKRKKGEVFNYTKHILDIQLIQQFYSSVGYLTARVTPIEDINEETKTINYIFDIFEGDRVHVERILISGNEKTKNNVIRRDLRVREGEIFSTSAIQTSIIRLQRTQFFSKIEPLTRPGSVDGLVNLTFNVEEQRTGIFTAGIGFGTQSGFNITGDIREVNLAGLGYTLGIRANVGVGRQFLNVFFIDPYFSGIPMSARLNFQVDVSDERLPTVGLATVETNGNTVFTNTSTQEIEGLPSFYRNQGLRTRAPYKELSLSIGGQFSYEIRDFYRLGINTSYEIEYDYWSRYRNRSFGLDRSQFDVYLQNRDKFGDPDENTRNHLPADPIHIINLGLSIGYDNRNDILNPSRGIDTSLALNIFLIGRRATQWTGKVAIYQNIPRTSFVFAFVTQLSTLGAIGNTDIVFPTSRRYTFSREDLRGWNDIDIVEHRSDFIAPRLGVDVSELLLNNGTQPFGSARLKHTFEFRWPILFPFQKILNNNQAGNVLNILGGVFFWEAGNLTRETLSARNLEYLYNPLNYSFTIGVGLRINIPQLPLRFYFAWKHIYDPYKKKLVLFNHNFNGRSPIPEVVFTIGGVF